MKKSFVRLLNSVTQSFKVKKGPNQSTTEPAVARIDPVESERGLKGRRVTGYLPNTVKGYAQPEGYKRTKMSDEKLNILCFGDSLTEGYSQYGLKFTPYGITLKALLDEQLLDTEADVNVQGVSGELVTNSMAARMRRFYEATKNEEPFDWLVFLGGTNDLGWGKGPDEIWAAIQEVTDIPRLKDGAKVLLCTIPECRVRSEKLDGKRDTVNERIRGDQRERVYVFDLNKKIPYHDMDEDERDVIWDDGLHLTEAGYERFGLMVGRRLLGIIEHGEGREDGELIKPVTETGTVEDGKKAEI